MNCRGQGQSAKVSGIFMYVWTVLNVPSATDSDARVFSEVSEVIVAP